MLLLQPHQYLRLIQNTLLTTRRLRPSILALRTFLFQLYCRILLYQTYYFPYCHRWRNRRQYMKMVFIMIHRLELYQRIMLCDFRQLLVKISKNSLIVYLFPIFCHQYNVIIALINTMRKMYIFHPSHYTTHQDAGITSSLDLTVGELSLETLNNSWKEKLLIEFTQLY
jgi:hypothetical protein